MLDQLKHRPTRGICPLLGDAKRVLQRYATFNQGANGENFNLFHLLGVGHLEVSTHSSLLSDLLDPQGSHGQGEVFLRHFVDVFELGPLPPGRVKVSREVGIGAVTESTGGRLDLVITCGEKRAILIENKIHAAEQSAWVVRYLNHAPGAKLVYLTLHGDRPLQLRDGDRPANLYCRSYSTHVVEWLKRCRKEATSAPLVRESLSQYLQLVRELTQQNNESPMNKELVEEATRDRTSLEAYLALRNVEGEIRAKLVRGLQDDLAIKARKRGLDFQREESNDLGFKGAGFEFRVAAPDSGPVYIRFEFDKGGYQGFAFGFVDHGRLSPGGRKRLRERFARAFHSPEHSEIWPAWIFWAEHENWRTGTTFVDILEGRFASEVMLIVATLQSLLSEGSSASES